MIEMDNTILTYLDSIFTNYLDNRIVICLDSSVESLRVWK